jgi:thioredoxin reductase
VTAPESVVIVGAGPVGLTAAYMLGKGAPSPVAPAGKGTGRDAPVVPRSAIETAAGVRREEGTP